MSDRADALHVQIDLTAQGAGSDFEVAQALRQLADHISSRRFTGLSDGTHGELLLEQDGGSRLWVGNWSADRLAVTARRPAPTEPIALV